MALLRGINVGGHRPVPMAELRDLFRDLVGAEVQTYIQSGNVVYPDPNGAVDRPTIEAALAQRFGFEVTVLLRAHADLLSLIECLPFPEAAQADPRRVSVSFLSVTPAESNLQALLASPDLGDTRLAIHEQHVFMHCPGGAALSKVDNKMLERRLECQATNRNWRTVLRLEQMCAQAP